MFADHWNFLGLTVLRLMPHAFELPSQWQRLEAQTPATKTACDFWWQTIGKLHSDGFDAQVDGESFFSVSDSHLQKHANTTYM